MPRNAYDTLSKYVGAYNKHCAHPFWHNEVNFLRQFKLLSLILNNAHHIWQSVMFDQDSGLLSNVTSFHWIHLYMRKTDKYSSGGFFYFRFFIVINGIKMK